LSALPLRLCLRLALRAGETMARDRIFMPARLQFIGGRKKRQRGPGGVSRRRVLVERQQRAATAPVFAIFPLEHGLRLYFRQHANGTRHSLSHAKQA
jgi:hypothetical protein